MSEVDVSFVVPCYNERENVELFFEEFRRIFSSSSYSWELVMVDDGSSDRTFEVIKTIAETNKNVKGIQFSRNFGKEAAVWAGLGQTVGRYVGIIDADLQQPPSDALEMVNILEHESEYDCVAAYQKVRAESGTLSKCLHSGFYKVMSKACNLDMVQDASDFRVFKRSVRDAILSLSEYYRFSKGIFAWIGFNTYAYPYVPRDRENGESKWSFASLAKYAVDGILSFSTSLLRMATVLGLSFSVAAILYSVYIVARTLVFGIDVPGYASVIALILALGGIQLLVIGVMGEYLARMYIQGKHRPICVIKEETNI